MEYLASNRNGVFWVDENWEPQTVCGGFVGGKWRVKEKRNTLRDIVEFPFYPCRTDRKGMDWREELNKRLVKRTDK